MKRWISSLILAGIAGVVMAQAPFTIVRPADGSKVREKVRILIPKNSIPSGGYVGVFLDGKLIEATVPPVEGKYHVYTLDTKGRGIADTTGKPIKLELVLYREANDQAQIVDRSSVDLYVSNKANIPVPNRGLSLRYRFTPGSEMIYTLDQRVILSSISERDQKNGGRAAQQDVESEKLRLLYAVDNAYSDGDGLLRIQALPSKGKDYAELTLVDDLQQKRYYADQMASIYMRINNRGWEEFAALPPYIPLNGSGSGIDPLNLFAVFPLPTLPEKSVRPGDSWPSRFQEADLDLSKYPNIDKVTSKLDARGEFVDTEWEMGHPCAKLQNTIEVADLSALKKKQVQGQMNAAGAISDDKVSVKETIWFALDTKKVIKIVRDINIERKTEAAGGFGGPGGGGPGAQGSGAAGGKGRPGGTGPGGMGPGGGGGGAAGTSNQILPGSLRQGMPGRGGGGPPQGPGGPGGPPQGVGMPGRSGAPSGFGGQGAGMGNAGATFVRVRILQIFTLEK
ncbi:MAG TPA: hypothetical protein VK934_11470 [Fimbriimonas sp.]|nr:hypothetical protein [Fimbriimonas sp.]